jgi:hypothetical protein
MLIYFHPVIANVVKQSMNLCKLTCHGLPRLNRNEGKPACCLTILQPDHTRHPPSNVIAPE